MADWRSHTLMFSVKVAAPKEEKTSRRALPRFEATMSADLTLLLAIKPRARASAICPAPMKPIRLVSLKPQSLYVGLIYFMKAE